MLGRSAREIPVKRLSDLPKVVQHVAFFPGDMAPTPAEDLCSPRDVPIDWSHAVSQRWA